MQSITGNYPSSDHDWLLRLIEPERTRVLFLANYAPSHPMDKPVIYDGDGSYPAYHYNVLSALRSLGLQVYSSSSPNALFTACGRVDYVYSLLNRMPMRDSEIFVSSLCEFLDLPYLGAPPSVRAIAADKYLFKMVAENLGLPVPRGAVYRREDARLRSPPFNPPYFIKDRSGAASEGIDRRNMADDWPEATEVVRGLQQRGKDALVEEFSPGIDVTVPVVGGVEPRILGLVEPRSDEPENIITHTLKLDDHLGYRLTTLPPEAERTVRHCVDMLWQVTGPVDYFRFDFRYDQPKDSLRLLEMNICCHFEEGSAIALAAESRGVSFLQVLEHILAFSLERQGGGRQQLEWVL